MKLKIFSLCIAIYIVTLAFTGLIVSKNTYSSLLQKEVNRSLNEEKNLKVSAVLYIMVNMDKSKEGTNIEDYAAKISDMFGTKDTFVEVYSKEGKLLSANPHMNWPFKREEILEVNKTGRNYMLRELNGKHYLFVNDELKANDGKLIISYIKDISQVDIQMKEEHFYFLRAGIIGLFVIGLITAALSNIVLKPIADLSNAAKEIASGNYEKRVELKNRDEVGVLAVQFNIMAEEIEKKVSELEKEAEVKQRFTDNLTHELRTPLTSIIGYSDLLMKTKYDEQNFNKGLGYINSEGNRMLKLINSLMDMIMLRENGFDKRKCSPEEIVYEAVEVMEGKAKDKKIELVVCRNTLKAAFINADKDMLKGVLINLIDNAIKASYEASKIEIGVNNIDNKLCFYVKDSGCGMGKSEIEKVTEPFYRADKSRSRKQGGVGLGLSICSMVASAHGGKINIESEKNQGTTVSMIIPIGDI